MISQSAKSPPGKADSTSRAYPYPCFTLLETLEWALAHEFVTTCDGSTCIYKLTGMITDGFSLCIYLA